MHDLIVWVCRTPRRLMTIVGVPIVLLVAVGSFLTGHRTGGTSTAARTPAAVASSSPSVQAQVPDATPFISTAVRFVGVWARLAPGQTPAQWHRSVDALVTPDLAKTLDLTDTRGLADSTASGTPVVRFVSTDSSLIAVPLASGRTVLVTVVSSGGSWLVSDIQPDQGN